MRTSISILFSLIFFNLTIAQKLELEDILEKHFEVTSQRLWDQIPTFEAEGIWRGATLSFPVTFLAKKPEMIKFIDKEKDFVYAFSGKEAWAIRSDVSDIQTLKPDEIEIMILLFHFGSPLVGKKNLKYKGDVYVDYKMCFWISFNDKKSNSLTEYFIDKETFLLYKINHRFYYKGQTRMISKILDDYRAFGELQIPTFLQVKTEVVAWEFTFDDILLGNSIPDQIFNMPTEVNK